MDNLELEVRELPVGHYLDKLSLLNQLGLNQRWHFSDPSVSE